MTNEKNSTGISDIRKKTHESVDKIMDNAESIRDSSNEKIAHMKDKAHMMRENVDGYIQKNPETSVLIAAGVGAILGGVLTAAIMRRRH